MSDDPLWFLRTLIIMLCGIIVTLAIVSSTLTLIGYMQ